MAKRSAGVAPRRNISNLSMRQSKQARGIHLSTIQQMRAHLWFWKCLWSNWTNCQTKLANTLALTRICSSLTKCYDHYTIELLIVAWNCNYLLSQVPKLEHQYHVPKMRNIFILYLLLKLRDARFEICFLKCEHGKDKWQPHNKKAFQSKANIFLANRCTVFLVNKFEQVHEGVLMCVGEQSWSWTGDP